MVTESEAARGLAPDKLALEFLLRPEFTSDPYPDYARLRALGPIHPIDFPPGASAFLVVDYEHGRQALADPRLSKDLRRLPEWFGGILLSNMLTSDPPDHARLRAVVGKALLPRRTEALRPRIQEVADQLVDAMAPKGEADLVEEFAFPLPMTVMCELLGLPFDDRENLRVWSHDLTALDPELEDVDARVVAYFAPLLEARRARPGPDLITALLGAEGEEGTLSEEEVISTLTLLVIAGHETGVKLIASGMLALLLNPDQLALLRERPDLLPGAVEEMLRYDGPGSRATVRIATEDMVIAGTAVPVGSIVHVALHAANRDPAVFESPDRLDVCRGGRNHLAFGHGIHHCVGAHLGRLEVQIAIGTLLRRMPDMSLACSPDELAWGPPGGMMRGLQALPVRFG